MRLHLTTAALLAALLQSGCMTTYKTAIDHYDECAVQPSSFPTMVDCGKQRRNAYCKKEPDSCGAKGEAFVQYADALALSVKNKEMSEAEARRRFAEFKMKILSDRSRDEAIASTAPVATTCTQHGTLITCN